MSPVAHDPVLFAFAVSTLVLVLNILVLWNLSGAVRGRTGTTANPEDAAAFGRNLADGDPPEVARVLRAHRNTADNTYAFLFLGLVFIHLHPGALEAQIFFYGFAAARVLFSICYLKGIQPWRTVAYGLGLFLTLGLVADIGRLLFA